MGNTRCPAPAADRGAGGKSAQKQFTDRARHLQALDGHPFRERLLIQPDLFLRTIPEYRRRRNGTCRRGGGQHQILDPRVDELRDRVAVLERQLLEVVSVMAG